jgi:hypothetical protein
MYDNFILKLLLFRGPSRWRFSLRPQPSIVHTASTLLYSNTVRTVPTIRTALLQSTVLCEQLYYSIQLYCMTDE